MRWPTTGTFTSLTHYYRSLLRNCARTTSLQDGQKLHATLLKNGLTSSPNAFLHNALLQVYAACGNPISARKVFDQIPQSYRDTIDWTILMTCYARIGLPDEALRFFRAMQGENVLPDEVTFVCFFNACSKLGDLLGGSQGHLYMIKRGIHFTITASNAAMDMYTKCGRLCDARKLFDEMGEKSVVSWTIILTGAIKWEGVENGRCVFDEMPERNEVAWTVMIAGYIENGFTKEAFLLVKDLLSSMYLELNYVTLCSFLSACAQSGDFLMGKWVHVHAVKTMGNEVHLMVATALVDMYSKCGRIDKACKVFESIPYRNVVAWNAMLSGLAMHGRGMDVLDHFSQLVAEVKPDDATFVSVLSACNHLGLVDQGYHYFRDLGPHYSITPKIEHYACMVDLLGRAGRLEEAMDVVKGMPVPPNEVIFGSLLAACRLDGKLELAEDLMKELIQIDPLNTECHVLLSNMYAVAGRKDIANSLRQILKSRGVRKVPGMSSIYVDGQVHRFCSGDKSHPKTEGVYIMLGEMIRKLRLVGYVPNTGSQIFSVHTNEVSNANVREEMEQVLFSHSEKLAISFGLISTKPGTPLYIFKNLRICQDCHSAVKIISYIYKREIVIRDRNRFHRFTHGSCSCSDYW